MNRKLTAATAALLAAAMLTGCSAYSNPKKYVSVPNLSELTISQAEIDKEKKEQIESLLDQNRKENYKKVDDVAKKGDQVTITYEGKPTDSSVKLTEDVLKGMKTGKDSDGKDITYDLILGSGSFIGDYTKDGKVTHEGFEDQIIAKGAKAGDKFDINVKFPDDYGTAALKGVEVTFTVVVKEVARLTVDADTLIEVGYTFEEIKTEEDKKDEEAPTTEEEPTTEEAPATGEDASGSENQSEGTTTGSSTEADREDEEETTKAKFTDLFKAGKFTIDYAEDADDSKFNTIFKIADYRSTFTGKNLYEEIEVEYTIPEDVEEKFKDYKGETIKIKFTVNSATVLPEWNDELVKEISAEKYSTVAAYEEALVKEIKIDLALVAVENVVKYNGYPKSEAKKLYKSYVQQMIESKIGKSLDEVSNKQLKSLITDAELQSIYESASSQAIAAVQSRLLIEYLCEELDVTLTKKEYKELLEKAFNDYMADTSTMYYYYQYYGVIFSTAADLESYFGKDSMELQFKTNKMSEELVKVVKVVD